MNCPTAHLGIFDPTALIARFAAVGAVKTHPGPRRGPRKKWSDSKNAEYQRRWRERNPETARQRVGQAMRRLRKERLT